MAGHRGPPRVPRSGIIARMCRAVNRIVSDDEVVGPMSEADSCCCYGLDTGNRIAGYQNRTAPPQAGGKPRRRRFTVPAIGWEDWNVTSRRLSAQAASLHCALTSFAALLRWTCWSILLTQATGMK